MHNNLIIFAVFLVTLLIACQSRYPQGERLYLAYCSNCHMDDGTGLARLIPPLRGSDQLDDLEQVVCRIFNGSESGLTVNGVWYSEPMPSFSNLTAVELSNLINYISTTWDNSHLPTNPGIVEVALTQCD